MVEMYLSDEEERVERNFQLQMRENLTKSERIGKRKELNMVFSHGNKISCRGGKLLWIKNSRNHSRFAVTLVRKYGNSVERNKAKRIFRELYRINKSGIYSGYDLVFVLYPFNDDFTIRSNHFFSLLKKAELLKM